MTSRDRDMGQLIWMRCFVRAAETGSFSAVARELHMGQPNVSRHISSLEEHLGVRLLHRTTRRLSLTPEGQRYYEDTRKALDAIAEAESVARGDDVPRGSLRIACSVSLAEWHVRPVVMRFLERYPEIEIEMHVSDQPVDLVAEGVDFAIRAGSLKSSGLLARRIGTSDRTCVATPAYLARHPAPVQPHELASHNCIPFTSFASGNVWEFGRERVAVRGRYRTNNLEGVRSAVLAGLGIGMVPVWMFERELVDGTVQALLVDHPSPSGEIHLLYPARRLLSRRASMLMDLVAEASRPRPRSTRAA